MSTKNSYVNGKKTNYKDLKDKLGAKRSILLIVKLELLNQSIQNHYSKKIQNGLNSFWKTLRKKVFL